MVRMALIASLVAVNASVWIGPAEVLASRGKAYLNLGPDYEDAQHFVAEGDFAAAAREFAALVETQPNDATFRADYGLLCLNNGDVLRAELGWSNAQLAATTREQMQLARDLDPDNIGTATYYAYALMDRDFFGAEVSMEFMLDAWRHVLSLLEAQLDHTGDEAQYAARAGHAWLQMARVAQSYGDSAARGDFIEEALAINPTMRIPESLHAS